MAFSLLNYSTIKTIYLKKKVLILAIAIAVPLATFALFSQRGLLARLALEQEKVATKDEITVLLGRQDSLRTLIKRLENDPFLIEQIARERYGMIREGETVYLLEAD